MSPDSYLERFDITKKVERLEAEVARLTGTLKHYDDMREENDTLNEENERLEAEVARLTAENQDWRRIIPFIEKGKDSHGGWTAAAQEKIGSVLLFIWDKYFKCGAEKPAAAPEEKKP